MTLLHHEALWLNLREETLEKRLVVTPILDSAQVGAASIDLRLGTEFLFLRRTDRAGFDPKKRQVETTPMYDRLSVPLGNSLWLHPGHFLLGSTLEFVRMPVQLAGLVLGRSSWGRLGLVVETASMVQPGFAGRLTYELVNMANSPIALYPGLRVAQLAVFDLPGPTGHADLPQSRRYRTKYLSAVGPEASRLAWEEGEFTKLDQVGEALHTIPAFGRSMGSDR